jgi:hypothetical protein
MTGSKLLLSLTVVGSSALWAQSPQPCKFGEKINLSFGAQLTVKRMNAAELRSRYASDFPGSANLAAFEFRWGKEGIYEFHTDREDPARSDIVALCSTDRVNLFKTGTLAPRDRQYKFARPGGYQLIDNRWVTITSGGDQPMIMTFELPPACTPDQAQIEVVLEVREVGQAPAKKSFDLLISDAGPK